MTEEDMKILMDASLKEINPIVKQVTHLIFDAYEIGFNAGMKVGKKLPKDENNIKYN